MSDTLQNIKLNRGVWVDLYAESSISVGTKLTIENLSQYPVKLYSGANPPSGSEKDSELGLFVRIMGYKQKLNNSDNNGLWAYSDVINGLVGVTAAIAIKVSTDNLTSAFGEQLTTEEDPIYQISAKSGLVGVLTAALGGTATVENKLFKVSTGTGANNVSAIVSAREASQRPGQGLSDKFSAIFNVGVADSQQQSGFITSESSLVFAFEGVDFGVLVTKDGALEIQELTISSTAVAPESSTVTVDGVPYSVPITASTVEQNAYEITTYLNLNEPRYRFTSNSDKVIALARLPDFGAGTFDFSSTTATATWFEVSNGILPVGDLIKKADWNVSPDFDIDPTKYNEYKIQTDGNVKFFIKNKDTGDYVLVHMVKRLNMFDTPLIEAPTFRLGWAVRNTGNITDIVLKGSYASAFVEGKVKYNQPPKAAVNVQFNVGLNLTNIISFRNRSTFQEAANRNEIIPLLLSLATDSTKPVVFEIIQNPITDTFLDWVYIEDSDTLMECSKTAALITGGNLVSAINVTSLGRDVDMQKLLEYQVPGAEFSIAAQITAGSPSEMTASGNWKEDLF